MSTHILNLIAELFASSDGAEMEAESSPCNSQKASYFISLQCNQYQIIHYMFYFFLNLARGSAFFTAAAAGGGAGGRPVLAERGAGADAGGGAIAAPGGFQLPEPGT